MKKSILIAVSAIFATFALSESGAFAGEITKKLDFASFAGIESSASCEINLKSSGSYNASVKCDSLFQDYIEVYVKNNILKIDVNQKSMPADLKKIWKAKDSRLSQFTVTVGAPAVSSVEISGDTKLVSAQGSVSTSSFKINVTDRAKASGLEINTKKATINASNNGNIDMKLVADNMDIDASGSSVVNVNVSSGASSVKVAKSTVTTLTGNTKTLSIAGSGSGNLNALGFEAGSIAVVLENSSTVTVSTSGTLSLDMKGNSHVYFQGKPVFDIVKILNSSVEPYSDSSKK